MEHGSIRNHRLETEYSDEVELVNNLGIVVFRGSMITSETSVSERYCEPCDLWSEVRGIMGALLGCPDCERPWNQNS